MSEALLFSVERYLAKIPDDNQSAPQRVFSLIWALESEVNNGGFWQFFYNLSGEYAPQTPKALIQIGGDHCSEIVAQAIHLIPIAAEGWRDETLRRTIISNLSGDVKERLDELDKRFFQYPDDLGALLTAFVNEHLQDFGM